MSANAQEIIQLVPRGGARMASNARLREKGKKYRLNDKSPLKKAAEELLGKHLPAKIIATPSKQRCGYTTLRDAGFLGILKAPYRVSAKIFDELYQEVPKRGRARRAKPSDQSATAN